MRAIIAARVSTDDQAESGNGINAQLDACRAWAARQGCPVVGPFLDEGISGAAPLDKRPGLLLALAEVGKGDVLLVAKRDRLGRDVVIVATIEAMVRARGGRVISAAGEGTEGDAPADALMRMLIDSFAVYERLVIKARTKAALDAKARRGERTGKVPIGRLLVDDGRRSKAGRPLALIESLAELATIDLIRELRSQGLGPRPIARELTARGIPTKEGGALWAHTTIIRILKRLDAEPTHRTDEGHPCPPAPHARRPASPSPTNSATPSTATGAQPTPSPEKPGSITPA